MSEGTPHEEINSENRREVHSLAVSDRQQKVGSPVPEERAEQGTDDSTGDPCVVRDGNILDSDLRDWSALHVPGVSSPGASNAARFDLNATDEAFRKNLALNPNYQRWTVLIDIANELDYPMRAYFVALSTKRKFYFADAVINGCAPRLAADKFREWHSSNHLPLWLETCEQRSDAYKQLVTSLHSKVLEWFDSMGENQRETWLDQIREGVPAHIIASELEHNFTFGNGENC